MRLAYNAANYQGGDGSHNGLLALIGSNSLIKIYSGGVNTTADDTPAGTLLATITVPSMTLTPATKGNPAVLTAATMAAATVAASGTAACYQHTTSGGTPISDGTVSTTGADINFASGVAWLAGGQVTLSSYTITEPVT